MVIDHHSFGEFVDEARDAVSHAIRGGDDLVGFLWLKRHAGAIRATATDVIGRLISGLWSIQWRSSSHGRHHAAQTVVSYVAVAACRGQDAQRSECRRPLRASRIRARNSPGTGSWPAA